MSKSTQPPSWPTGPDGQPPRLVGHRGAAAHAPENTLAGIRVAARQGVNWIEVDARLTADGVPVLMHDETLDRTTTGTGPVRSQSWRDLAELDAGRWFGSQFENEPIPSLEQALALAQQLGLSVNVELKPDPDTASETGRAVGQMPARASGVKILYSCFDRDCLVACIEAAPALARALNVDIASNADCEWARIHGCAAVHISHVTASAAQIDAVRTAGMAVGVFTVNDAREAAVLFGMGADYLFTDNPAALMAAVPNTPN